ncbi:MAG: hypothetical protein R2726_06765 [Acidimicrobiales bacterium]
MWGLVEVAVADPAVGTIRVDLIDQTATAPRLPFEVAWWFPPTGYLAWQAVGDAFGLRVLTGWVAEAGGRIRHGCWIADIDQDRADAIALLAGQPVLVEWAPTAVTVATAGHVDDDPVAVCWEATR